MQLKIDTEGLIKPAFVVEIARQFWVYWAYWYSGFIDSKAQGAA